MIIFDNVYIHNFKSIRDIEIQGLKTYNLFVGKPNVGKSNILEGLATMAVPYVASKGLPLNSLLRVDSVPQIFHNGNVDDDVLVEFGGRSVRIAYNASSDVFVEYQSGESSVKLTLSDMYLKKTLTGEPLVKPYMFNAKVSAVPKQDTNYLTPVSGYNLMKVVQNNEMLKNRITQILKGYGLNLIFDTAKQSIQIMKKLDENTSFIIPYSSIADTLQRLLFFEAATLSNKHSVLTFEELESHAYPPYIVKIVQTILQNRDNQYFITTHSPYVVNEFLQSDADVAIHIVDYKDGETRVKTLSDEEVDEVYNYGIDLFFNAETFLD